METEKKISRYVTDTAYEELPEEPIEIAKNVILTILGTTLAGAHAEGCGAVLSQVRQWGGRKEATILVHGGKVPAYNAALVNSAMARALDFCDGMIPGMHLGSSAVPTGLAAAELAGGCSGKEFLTALVVGMETASRVNSISVYDGFDPTGVCSILGATAIAGRILRLDSQQMLNGLALAFNKAGGSMQSNIDGSLAVRMIQGFASQSGIISAELARRGITGPKNFLEGIYGYFHLYAKDQCQPEALTQGLGQTFEMRRIMFKKYPSCGGTLAPTDAILDLIRERDLNPEDVERVDVKVSPHVYKLVGGPFKIGENPKVDAQFNIQYCAANALLRKCSKLPHFDESYVKDPEIMQLIKKVYVSDDPAFEDPGKFVFTVGAHVRVAGKQGGVYDKSVEIPRGFPGNPLTKEEHMERFQDCINYSEEPLPKGNIRKIISMVDGLEKTKDIRTIIPLLLVKAKKR